MVSYQRHPSIRYLSVIIPAVSELWAILLDRNGSGLPPYEAYPVIPRLVRHFISYQRFGYLAAAIRQLVRDGRRGRPTVAAALDPIHLVRHSGEVSRRYVQLKVPGPKFSRFS
jgi:hypothetical protein